MNLFRIVAEHLRNGPVTFDVQEQASAFGIEDEEEYRFHDPVTGSVKTYVAGHDVRLSGWLGTIVTTNCGSCLEVIRVPIRASVELTFVNDKRLADKDETEDFFDEDVVYYDGEVVEAREHLRELLIVELPPFPHCDQEPGRICTFKGSMTFGPASSSREKPITPVRARRNSLALEDNLAWKSDLARLAAELRHEPPARH